MQPVSTLSIEDDLSVFVRQQPVLTPTQRRVEKDLRACLTVADVAILRMAAGMGRTTVLRGVWAQTGGALVVARQSLALLKKRTQEVLEQRLLGLLSDALDRNDVVLVDDFHLAMQLVDGANVVMAAILDSASRQGKKFVFAVASEVEPASVRQRGIVWDMEAFEADDYARIAENYLGSAAKLLDMVKVHRAAPALTAYQIKHACLWLGLRYASPSTESLIDYLRFRMN